MISVEHVIQHSVISGHRYQGVVCRSVRKGVKACEPRFYCSLSCQRARCCVHLARLGVIVPAASLSIPSWLTSFVYSCLEAWVQQLDKGRSCASARKSAVKGFPGQFDWDSNAQSTASG